MGLDARSAERASRAERHGHCHEAANEVGGAQRQVGIIVRELQIRQSPAESTSHCAQFEPGQLIVEAEVRAKTEGRVVIWCAMDIEDICAGEHGFVEVRSFEER